MLFSARFLHTGHPMHMLAAIANCSFYRARSSILRWVPRWYETAKAFTRLTSLGAYPHVIEQLQPAKKSSSRKRVGDGEDSDSSRDDHGNNDHDNDDRDNDDNDGRDNDDHDNDDSSHAASSVDEDKQTDEGELTCSATQARNRWPAKAIFGRVPKAPALQGTIPSRFLNFVEQARAVAYLNVLTCDFNVEPEGWSSSRAHLDRVHGSGSHRR